MDFKLNKYSLQRIYFFLFLVYFFFRWKYGIVLHQVCNNEQFDTSKDLSFIIIQNSPFLYSIIKSCYTSIFVDIVLMFSAIASLIWVRKKYIVRIFIVSLLYYSFALYASNKVGHNLLGAWLMALPIAFSSKENLKNVFLFVRITACWIYFSAGYWKLLRGAFSFEGFFATMIKYHNVLIMYQNPNTFGNQIRYFIIENPEISHFLFQALILLELAFFIGFFTSKFDTILGFSILSFHWLTWLFADTYFVEFSLLTLIFIVKPFFIEKKNYSVFYFLRPTPQRIILLFLLSLHLVPFTWMHYIIKNGLYKKPAYSMYPYQNYMMYSDPFTRNNFSEYMIISKGKCINCNAEFPPKRNLIQSNLNCFVKLPSNSLKQNKQKEWLIRRIRKDYNLPKNQSVAVYSAHFEFKQRPKILKKNLLFED